MNTRLLGWGNNTNGQLFPYDTPHGKYTKPVVIDDKDSWTDMSLGHMHTLGIKSDGSLWGWGNNIRFQLGLTNPSEEETIFPPTLIFDSCQQVRTKYSTSIAIKSDGSLWGWGNNDYFQLGLGHSQTQKTPIKLNDLRWKTVSIGRYHTAAIDETGLLWVWGTLFTTYMGQRITVPECVMPTLKTRTISSGDFYSIGIAEDGTLWGFGINSAFELGSGIQSPYQSMTQLSAETDWLDVCCGQTHSIATKTDGSVWIWGLLSRVDGLLSPVVHKTPHWLKNVPDARKVCCNQNVSLILTTEGILYGFGSNVDSLILGEPNGIIDNPRKINYPGRWNTIFLGQSHAVASQT